MAKPEQVSDEELRALFEQAHGQMRSGQGTEAVKTVSKAYLRLLELKPDLLEETIEPRPGREMPAVMRWPMLGANLTMESVMAKQPRIEFVRDRFSVSDAIMYYEYALDSTIAAGV